MTYVLFIRSGSIIRKACKVVRIWHALLSASEYKIRR